MVFVFCEVDIEILNVTYTDHALQMGSALRYVQSCSVGRHPYSV